LKGKRTVEKGKRTVGNEREDGGKGKMAVRKGKNDGWVESTNSNAERRESWASLHAKPDQQASVQHPLPDKHAASPDYHPDPDAGHTQVKRLPRGPQRRLRFSNLRLSVL
jgi:hypothetical protein